MTFVLFCFAKKVQKKATRKPCQLQAGMYIAFSGRSFDLAMCTVVNSSGSLIGS